EADGSPLDLSVYPTTHLTLDQFRLLQIVINHPDEPTVINNLSTDSRVDENMLEWAEQAHVAASMLLPLKTADTWHGMIGVSYKTPQQFAPELQDIWNQIMPTAASVMKARRAYLQEIAAQRETELLYNFASRLSGAKSRHELLSVVSDYAIEQGGTGAALM